MKLRFEVDQAEAFRQGIDVPKSIVTIEVNPADLSQERRNLIADRLNGIDVCQLAGIEILDKIAGEKNGKPFRIVTKLPTFESLLEAIVEDQARVGVQLPDPLKRLEESEITIIEPEIKSTNSPSEILEKYLSNPKC